MKVFYSLPEGATAEKTIIALGNFDGVHKGHQALISYAVNKAEKLNYKSVILTFDPHPLKLLKPGEFPKLILTNQLKTKKIAQLAAEELIFLPFDQALAAMSPEDFILFISQRLNPHSIVIGFNYTYGYCGRGNAASLQASGQRLGFEVDILPPQKDGNELISSTAVRNALSRGAIDEATKLLGAWPVLEGRVIGGDQRGRKLGFPTANLAIGEDILLPPIGVYVAKVVVGENHYRAVLNIGKKPTFGAQETIAVEVHLLEFQGDLYHMELELHLLKYLRPEKKFNDWRSLVAQISQDINSAKDVEMYL